MEVVRSFISVGLSTEMKDVLRSLEDKLKAGRHTFVKWVDPESVHLTLKFLGNIPQKDIVGMVATVSRIAGPLTGFSLKVEGLGSFPNWQRPQVVWVGIGGEVNRLVALQADIEEALSALGFPRETRRFSPHLTLGRLRERVSAEERRGFAEWVQSIQFEGGLTLDVREVKVMKSRLTPGGAIYNELASIRLKDDRLS